MMELKDWLNSINFTKEDMSEHIRSYPPYIINKCLSSHIDCILFANEMNKYHHLDKDMQYSFYINTLRKRKRFSPWLKKDKIKDLIEYDLEMASVASESEKLAFIKSLLGYSYTFISR